MLSRYVDKTVDLPNGSTVAFWEFGDPSGVPVLGLHGTPICGLCFAPLHRSAADHGIRLIAPDRPGVGHSSRRRGYSVASWTALLGEFADTLGVDRFGIIGWSSGGPYALSAAARIPERLLGVAVVAAMAPIKNKEDLRFYADVDRRILGVARSAPWLLRLRAAKMVRKARRDPDATFAELTSGLRQADRDLIAAMGPRDEAFSFFPATINGSPGLADDYIALAGDWGFELADVRLAPHIFVGDADPTIPVEVGEILRAGLVDAQLTVLPDEGHLLIYTHSEKVLAAATDGL